MEIQWTQKALYSYVAIADYIHDKFGEKALEKFVTKTEHSLEGLSKNPEIFPKSQNLSGVRKGRISRNTSFSYLYQPRKKKIILLLFWDNRQSPMA